MPWLYHQWVCREKMSFSLTLTFMSVDSSNMNHHETNNKLSSNDSFFPLTQAQMPGLASSSHLTTFKDVGWPARAQCASEQLSSLSDQGYHRDSLDLEWPRPWKEMKMKIDSNITVTVSQIFRLTINKLSEAKCLQHERVWEEIKYWLLGCYIRRGAQIERLRCLIKTWWVYHAFTCLSRSTQIIVDFFHRWELYFKNRVLT